MTPRQRSILDGFFTADRAQIAAALDALPQQSCGRVISSGALYASGRYTQRDGIWSDAIFGPRTPLACPCGYVAGEASRDVVCAKCGVRCGDPELRTRRFGHVEMPPVQHPLVRDLVVTLAPVPPPGDRPFVAGLTPSQKLPWMGPVNIAWAALIEAANRRVRLGQAGAPDFLVAEEADRHRSRSTAWSRSRSSRRRRTCTSRSVATSRFRGSRSSRG